MYLQVAYKTVVKTEGLKYKYWGYWMFLGIRFAADEEFTLRAVGVFEGWTAHFLPRWPHSVVATKK